MSRNSPNRTVTLSFRFLGTVFRRPLKLRDLSGDELLRILTFALLLSARAPTTHRSSLSDHRIPHTYLLHPYPHFIHPRLTLLRAVVFEIGHPNDPAAISVSNNGMSLAPLPAMTSGAKESFEKLIGGYLPVVLLLRSTWNSSNQRGKMSRSIRNCQHSSLCQVPTVRHHAAAR